MRPSRSNVEEVFGRGVFPAIRLGADGFPPHRDGAAGGVPAKAARGDMELCQGTWQGSAVPWDPLLVLRVRGTWVQVASQDGVFWSEMFAGFLLPYREGSYLGVKKVPTTRAQGFCSNTFFKGQNLHEHLQFIKTPAFDRIVPGPHPTDGAPWPVVRWVSRRGQLCLLHQPLPREKPGGKGSEADG